MTPGATLTRIARLTRYLVEINLVDEQQSAFQRRKQRRRNMIEVTFENAEYISDALNIASYVEVYKYFVRNRTFNFKLLDGALVQMTYAFAGRSLEQHRLAFLSAPHLEQFGQDPSSYMEDEMYREIVARNILPVMLRFDYDSREDRHKDVAHPKSHLTFGEYDHCRIPVSAPLTPHRFVDFILRNFYTTRYGEFVSGLPCFDATFANTITPAERSILHVAVPA